MANYPCYLIIPSYLEHLIAIVISNFLPSFLKISLISCHLRSYGILLITTRLEDMVEERLLGDRDRDLPLLLIGERDRSLKIIFTKTNLTT